MIDLRYNKGFRRLLIKISYLLPERLSNIILDYLYPDDCQIVFGD